MQWLNPLIDVDVINPDEHRRARILNLLLLGIIVLSTLALLATLIGQILGLYTAQEARETYVPGILILGGMIVIYIVNRYWLGRIASILFLLFLVMIFFLTDTPYEIVWGRAMLMLAVPVIMASVILPPATSFLVAILIGCVFFFISNLHEFGQNIIGMLGYLAIALVSWLSARNLERAIADLREINQELDDRVAQRTVELSQSNKRLQKQITIRQQAEAALQTAHDELEQKVNLRTVELRKSNDLLQKEVSERKQTEIALAQRAHQLARSNAELQQFAYVASHDLREPLRKVRSYTELLQQRYEGQLDAKADKYIAYIVDGATRMQTLITDLLVYSRAGKEDVNLTMTDLSEVLNQVLADLEVTLQKSKAIITYDPLPVIKADTSQMTQLFQNLIGNAIKFCDQEVPQVQISAQRQNGVWHFAVSDNGIGIDPQYAERIFVIFQRLHSRSEYSGTGIGLAICKKVIENHHGRIWLESELMQGATFHFTIPM